MDRDGKTCELYASGMRNAYDFDFNAAGEMFTFDSDMEWDWGTPWYRPIRVCHLVSGGDYGFREGTGKFPTYYPESLPPVVDIGVGSPTGVKFGTRSAFPAKYRKALFIMDWSYGRILAVHLTPSGASYRGTFENFVVGKPLNVTDLEFGKDGAMYFTTGGRGTQSGLYRVTFAGASTAPHAPSADERKAEREAVEARALRHKLEAFHGKQDPQAIDFAWPHLNSPDRWIRYAARLAIESQPVDQWQKRALDERDVNASLTALLALARLGPKESQDELLENLGRSWPDGMNEEQKIEALRVSSLAFIRLGKPSTETAQDVAKSLAPLYPSASPRFNRELCQLLIYLDAPEVVQKTLGLLARAETEEEQLFYIFHLRQAKGGWSMDDRKTYFSWFNRDRARDKHSDETVKWFRDAGRDYADGASFPKFMSNIRNEAVASLTDEERAELAPLIAGQKVVAKAVVSRSFVKEWKLDDFSSSFDQLDQGRSFEKGREAFAVAQCLACHRFGNEGGSTGPDITGAASRFNHHDLLETILDPSKVVSDQYQNIVVTKKDGGDVTGRLVEEADDQIVLITNPLTGDRTAVSKRDIQKRAPSKISPMPEGLVTILSKEEILDLLAYIESGGKKDHGAFQRK